MHRRTFLKLAGLIAAGPALQTMTLVGQRGSGHFAAGLERKLEAASTPLGVPLNIQQPGSYLVSGLVRLEAPLVEISGISSKQSISWSASGGSEIPVARFVTFERYDRPGMRPEIQVRGGRLESLAVVPAD
jgi:hypothetical protein